MTDKAATVEKAEAIYKAAVKDAWDIFEADPGVKEALAIHDGSVADAEAILDAAVNDAWATFNADPSVEKARAPRVAAIRKAEAIYKATVEDAEETPARSSTCHPHAANLVN